MDFSSPARVVRPKWKYVRTPFYSGLAWRLTGSVFRDLAIVMVGFGLLVGTVFPVCVHFLGVPAQHVLTLRFHLYCLAAGLAVGAVNVWIANSVVRQRLRMVASRLEDVRATLERIQQEGDVAGCSPEECFLPVDSDDELGRTSDSFNRMALALGEALHTTSALRQLTERLVERLRLEEMAQMALEEMLAHTASTGGAVFLAKDGALQLVAASGLVDPAPLAGHPSVVKTFQQLGRARLEVPGGILMDRLLAHFPPRAVLVETIRYQDKGLGVALLASDRPYAEEEIRRFQLLSQPLALAFNNALAYDEMERVAALDGLTGCYNRRFGLARLREEFSRARRMEAPLSIVMFDVDHFKTVNDTWGHLAGDRVLIWVAKQARLVLRQEDALARYGGEEFLAVLPFTGEAEAGEVAERIRKAMEAVPVSYGRDLIPVTVSVGVATWPMLPVQSEVELIDEADCALYLAKRTGRNKVVRASQRLERSLSSATDHSLQSHPSQVQ